MRSLGFIIALFCLSSSTNVFAGPLPCGDHYCRGGRPPGPPRYNCSENIPPADGSLDKGIFDALNTTALPLPTPFPFMGYQKTVGRLRCTHMINTQTFVETYACTLKIADL
jgi:hypothetical protein